MAARALALEKDQGVQHFMLALIRFDTFYRPKDLREQ